MIDEHTARSPRAWSFWTWRSGYLWQRGFTFTRGSFGIFIGATLPPVGFFDPTKVVEP